MAKNKKDKTKTELVEDAAEKPVMTTLEFLMPAIKVLSDSLIELQETYDGLVNKPHVNGHLN